MKKIGCVGKASGKVLYTKERVGDAWVYRIVNTRPRLRYENGGYCVAIVRQPPANPESRFVSMADLAASGKLWPLPVA